jgi:hypothetical protein
MAGFICWVCRRKLKTSLPSTDAAGWGKCVVCTKTREAREPRPEETRK